MRSWTWWLLTGALIVSCFPGTARAESEVDVLLNKLVEKGVLTGVEAGQIRREISETKEDRNKQLAKEIVPDSARNWKWKGDLRLREEYRNRVGTGNDVNRQRVRFRFGFEGKVNDQLKVAARLATGDSADPISTNDTFDDFFRRNPILVDQAYVQYTPEVAGITKVSLLGGIMENPFWVVGPMVWDPDLSWDGVAAQLAQDVGPATFFTNNGVFALDSDESEAAALWVTQGGVSAQPFKDSSEEEVLKNLKLTASLSYADYANTSTSAKAGTDPVARVTTNTSGVKDFNEFNPSIELASTLMGVPMSLFGDWVRNVSAKSNVNDGYQVGIKVGKAKTPLSLKDGWEAGYFFQRLEPDAAFDEFVDSDFAGGGTNRIGNVYWVTFQVLKNSTLGVKYLGGHELKGAKANSELTQFDWVTKF